MDGYQEQLAQIGSLSDDDLATLESDILSAFDTADESDDLDGMAQAADALDQVRAEQANRGTAPADNAVDDTEGTDDGDGDEVPVAASGETSEAPIAPTDETVPETVTGEAVVASADEAPDETPTEPAVETEPEAVTAAAEVPESELPVDATPDEAPVDESIVASGADEAELPIEPEFTDSDVEAMLASGVPASLRKEAAKSGTALSDGSFPIESASDVPKAVHAIGRATKNSPAAIKRHIIKRARALNAMDKLPESWGVTATGIRTNPQTPEPVLASGSTTTDITEETTVDIPEDRQPVVTASAGSTITAGADIPGKSAGAEFRSMDEVSQAMIHRIGSVRRVTSGGDGEQLIVASVRGHIPDDRMLFGNDVENNAEKIREVVREAALVASGGYCAPLEVKYDLFGIGSSSRPVRDGLVGFGADRGGIRFVSPPVLSGLTNGVGVWTAAVDAAPGEAVKNRLTVACAQEQTATTDAVTLSLQFGNLATRAYPELVTRNNELGLIAHARLAEQTLLSKISAASTSVSSSFALGTTRDLMLAVAKASAGYRNRHRLDENTALRVILPVWILAAMREDVAYQQPGDGTLAVGDTELESYLAARNVNVTWHLDDVLSAQGNNATITDFPAFVDWYLFAEGTFLFLDGGTLDLGIVRDSTLVSTNDYVSFTESFEGVAKVGVESLHVRTTTHTKGGSSLPTLIA